ncbi:cell wall metabolism sensor histidine kinase WalK [Intestinibacillus massiliensis]|uniref:ATP-binding protein n=1 Tax=Intestinibacillus massiliensis TaxID=1871029 RepID=UPI000B35A54D|nr:ATP-binding protein [Intestinibacillus massiliensis]MCB6365309.1 cell wall metabolism sensor histidine kinase WalK [Intestinibacillus massiliensis]
MFRSLHMKLVLILVLLIISVMAVVGTFLINSVSNFYFEDFQKQVGDVFTRDLLEELGQTARGGDGGERLSKMISYYAGPLGLDNYRNYYILDGEGAFVAGSNQAVGSELRANPNIVAAMAGRVGASGSMADSYMDVAIPVQGDKPYIVYIRDTKEDIQSLTWRFFAIVMQAMLFGLLVAILLSFLLSKTITTPIENITKSAQHVAAGDFGQLIPIQSSDEIGELTRTFNNMSRVLKTTLEEVQGERDKLNTLFLHMTDGVAAFTTEGRIIHMNPATERLLGVEFREDMTFGEMFHSMALPDSEDAGKEGYVQTEIKRLGRTLNVLFAPYGGTGEGGIMAVIHDITEQRKLDDARREFVANVSHELRTPLTNIKSYTETLVDAAGDLPPETEVKFLGVISNEADRMTRIVKDLLTLSKLDYGRMDLRFTRFSLQTMLEGVHTAMLLAARDNGHELRMDLRGPLPDMVGDRERLEQVIVNIVSNSIKYTPRGGRIELFATMRDDRHVVIRVKDNGMGIPKEDVPRLFERFYRVDKARSREKGGTGLGLAIAKEMVEAHKGTIHLESELDAGTAVTIVLPTDLPLDGEKAV